MPRSSGLPPPVSHPTHTRWPWLVVLTLAIVLLHAGLLHWWDGLRSDWMLNPPATVQPSAGRWVIVKPRVAAPALEEPAATTAQPPVPPRKPAATSPTKAPPKTVQPARAREVNTPTEIPAQAPEGVFPLRTEAPSPVDEAAARSADDERHALQPIAPMPAVWLRYRARRGAQEGSAQLDWVPAEDGTYHLHWLVALDGSPETNWSSQGRWGSSGLEPLRMVESRRGRAQAAVNFQRDKGLVSFSGPSTMQPLVAGAQDRVSWLLQLPLLAQAMSRTWRAGDTVSLPVFTVRGEALEWRFTVLESPLWTSPDGKSLRTWHLRREPTQPYDQRVDIWLSREHAMVPVQIDLQTLPTSPETEPLSLQLIEGWPARETSVDLQP